MDPFIEFSSSSRNTKLKDPRMGNLSDDPEDSQAIPVSTIIVINCSMSFKESQ